MPYEIAVVDPPAWNLAADLAAAGLDPTFQWRPSGWIVFPLIDANDPAQVAAVEAVLASYVPTEPEPLPPTVAERVETLETVVAALTARVDVLDPP